MSDWKFLPSHAVTRYSSNLYREYVFVGKNFVGYVEQNNDKTWSYYQFAPQEKNVVAPPEPIFKNTGSTAAEAAENGVN